MKRRRLAGLGPLMLVAALYCYLVNESYLAEAIARGIDIRCEDGEVELEDTASPAPTLRMKWKRRTCRALRVGVEIWEAPFLVLIWAWQSTVSS